MKEVISLSNNKKTSPKKTVQIELSDLKMQALEMSLSAKNKRFDEAVNDFVRQIYEKNVPKETKNFLASVEGETAPKPTKEE